LAARLRGEHTFRLGQGSNLTVTVTEVQVVPQPFGTLFNSILNERGRLVSEEMAASRLGIIDIGTHTTDYILVEGLRYVEKGSDSIGTGMSQVADLTGREILDKYHFSLSYTRWTERYKRAMSQSMARSSR